MLESGAFKREHIFGDFLRLFRSAVRSVAVHVRFAAIAFCARFAGVVDFSYFAPSAAAVLRGPFCADHKPSFLG